MALDTMPENHLSTLKLLWTPPAATADRPLLIFVRVKLINMLIAASMMVLLPVVFLSAFFLRQRSLAAVGVVLLAVSMASTAVLEGFRIWLVSRLGRWTGWKQEPIWRNEQPMRYWTRTAVHAAIPGIYAAVAVFLVWSNWGWMAAR